MKYYVTISNHAEIMKSETERGCLAALSDCIEFFGDFKERVFDALSNSEFENFGKWFDNLDDARRFARENVSASIVSTSCGFCVSANIAEIDAAKDENFDDLSIEDIVMPEFEIDELLKKYGRD